MKKTIIILFVISTNILLGQNNNISFSVDSLKQCKDSLENQLNETKKYMSDIETIYSRWKLNKNIDVFFYANNNCSASNGSQAFNTDTNKVLNIRKGTKVIVVKVTPNAYKFYYDGKEYFINKKYLTRQKDYLKTENKKTLNNLIDLLVLQLNEIDSLEINESRSRTRKKYRLKKDSITQDISMLNDELSALNSANYDYYIITKDYIINKPPKRVFVPFYGNVKIKPKSEPVISGGTKVKVLRYSQATYSYEILLEGNSYTIRQDYIMPETELLLQSIIKKNQSTIYSFSQKIKEIETKLANFGTGEVYYFKDDFSVYTGQNARYNGGGNYEMTVPKGTKVVVVGEGYYTNEIVFNGKRYWVSSSCLVSEKKYLSELERKKEIRLKDSLAFANPTPHYFKEDGWLCDSLDKYNMFCLGDKTNVVKGTKVFFVKITGSTVNQRRCIVYYNDKLYYTATSLLVSEKSILEQKKWSKEQEEIRLEQNKQRQEYHRKRLINLENKYGSKIAKDIINGTIWIGMSDEMATESIGNPRKVNRTVTQYVVKEQWVYNSGVYLYFENGILTAWQD